MKRIPSLLLCSVAAFLLAAPASAQTFKILLRFPNQPGGGNPSALLDVNGNLYGTTQIGGPSKLGNIFELTSQGNESTLYSFTNTTPDGRTPTIGPLIQDAAGNFYGTTQNGGDYNCFVFFVRGCGTVFKLSPTGQETILHSFSGGADGAQPLAGLAADAAGNLYGTTYQGGTGCSGGCGTVYKVTPTGVESVLYSFTGGADGSLPYSVVPVTDAEGNLYGTTLKSGDLSCGRGEGCGTVFKVDPSGYETVLYSFTDGADGAFPDAGLARDSQGNLYGTTSAGGNLNCDPGHTGCGTVFKVNPSGSLTVLYNFAYVDTGYGPISTLVLDPAGNLYGTTLYGGAAQWGGVFKVSSHGVYSLLHSFNTGNEFIDGIWPMAGLTRDSAGNLFGTTSAGGKGSCANYYGCGVVFELTP
ncbi:MAG TPA: choice-of-anchor tandem repeat GloVer-containing protein [Candidatus Sulfotelmatobacter sp.]|jgi:uncharacterized repeat protein (TIGR03803 family)